jgi:aspartyl protease family protein
MVRTLVAGITMLLSVDCGVAQTGKFCFSAGIPPAAVIPDCNNVLADDPHHTQAFLSRGYAWYQLHQFERAIADYDAAIATDPKYIRAFYFRGLAWEAEGGLQKALEDLRTFLALDPSFEDAQTAMARIQKKLTKQTANPTLKSGVTSSSQEETIRMEQEGGVFVVPIRFNDVITLSAVVDSGAADVSVPADIVSTLIRSKTITAEDFLGEQTYVLADGSEVPSHRFRIRSLKVGNKIIENVVGSIASAKSTILLGQSFLNKCKSWSVDNERHVLVLR